MMWSSSSILLYLSPFVSKKDLRQPFQVRTPCEKLAVAACVSFAPICSTLGYLSILYMEFADSFAIQQSNVVMCTLLAWILLKEPLVWIDCICLVMTMTGIVLIARPDFVFGSHSLDGSVYTDRWKGTLIALVGATLSSLFGVSRRKIANIDHRSLAIFQVQILRWRTSNFRLFFSLEDFSELIQLIFSSTK